jgi:hypothetical protein
LEGSKWFHLSALTALLGSKLFTNDETGMAVTLIVGSAVLISTPIGMGYGYFKGRRYNELKRKNSKFHIKRLQIGQEFYVKGLDEPGGFNFLFRKNKKSKYIDRFKLGFSMDPANYNKTLPNGSIWSKENRMYVMIEKYFKDKILNPFVGFGGGYGYFNSEHENKIDPFIFIMVNPGININIFDILFMNLLVDYTPAKIKLEKKNKIDIKKLRAYLSIGTFFI